MKAFHTIESWASNIGYVVECEGGYFFWNKENEQGFKTARSVSEVIDSILAEVRDSYKGEK